MNFIEIPVHQFYNHTWYYPYMSDDFKNRLEEAFNKDEHTIMIDREELEVMFGQFLLRISN